MVNLFECLLRLGDLKKFECKSVILVENKIVVVIVCLKKIKNKNICV